jgi:hypothetical protein
LARGKNAPTELSYDELDEHLRDRPTSVKADGILWYVVDGDDRLVQASSGYFDFAAQNDLPEAGLALGDHLWDFVSGESVRTVQKALLRRVRRSGMTVVLPFRCDGPEMRREQLLTIGPGEGGEMIVFMTQVVAEHQRPRQALLDRRQQRATRAIAMCSWCDRVKEGSAWVEVEQAALALGLTNGGVMPTIDHELCERCALDLSRA